MLAASGPGDCDAMSAEQDREPLLARASMSAGAVFLSYASEDVSAAERIAAALRAAGIEVWIDKSELRGGDAWDQSIRRQIKACGLFIPVISRHAHDRIEGYFRLEWKLAVDRSHLIAPDQAFLLPVAIDDTPQSDERIPDRFRELQWTRLAAGVASPAFVDRVRRLLSHEAPSARAAATPLSVTSNARPSGGSVAPARRPKVGRWVTGAVIAVTLAGIAAERYWLARRSPPAAPPAVVAKQPAAPAPASAAVFNPPAHSVAVLPFVNMSGDAKQEYFSDGLTEELLNSLARLNELQVAGRTSAFFFKGKDVDLNTIAHKLNVAAVLEGSVRRSGHTVRVTAQLINGVTGFHLWSATYDRNLGDVLTLQTDVANAVASALKITLLGNTAAKIELGGTRNAAALDAYLRASRLYYTAESPKEVEAAIGVYSEAIRLDPEYAIAYAARSILVADFAWAFATGPSVHDGLARAQKDAERAIALAPELADGHLALAIAREEDLDFDAARKAYERARQLAPRDSRLERNYGQFAALMGQSDSSIAASRNAVALDPLDRNTYQYLGSAQYFARRYDDAVTTLQGAVPLDPKDNDLRMGAGFAFYMLGKFQNAASSCEFDTGYVFMQVCLAIAYDKLERHADAEAMLAKIRASMGDAGAFHYAKIYAQWGNNTGALDWLDQAMRLRSPWLEFVKAEPLLDPLRNEPRFQAIERSLKFPD